MRCLCLVNPIAGAGEGRRILEELTQLQQAGIFSGKVKEYDLAALPAAQELAAEFDLILVAGGDGSVSGLLPSALNSQLPLLLLPLGTGNDLARELALPSIHSREFLAQLLANLVDRPRALIDVWRLVPEQNPSRAALFCNYVSFGFDAEVVRRFHAGRGAAPLFLGRLQNKLRYLALGLACSHYRLGKTVLETSAEKFEFPQLSSLIFSNIRSYMGSGFTNSSGRFDDGCLEGLAVKSAWHYIKLGLGSESLGTAAKLLSSSPFWRVSLSSSEVPVQIDGEPIVDLNCDRYRIEKAGTISILSGSGHGI